jgi:hypothetical protein
MPLPQESGDAVTPVHFHKPSEKVAPLSNPHSRRSAASRRFLRNGLSRSAIAAQLLEFDQHRKRALKLPVQMDLIAP